MPNPDRTAIAHYFYRAFAAGDRDFAERILAPGFTFSSPLDIGLDRNGFFERCWPGAGRGQEFEFIRTVEAGDQVIVTYELIHADGSRGRNTEVLTFDGEQLAAAEVYFGWNVD